MTWRYQTVICKREGGPLPGADEEWLEVIEVFLNDDETLKAWHSPEPARGAIGSDPADLQGCLARMYVDALAWEPVRYDDLVVGQSFTKRLEPDVRRGLIAFLSRML